MTGNCSIVDIINFTPNLLKYILDLVFSGLEISLYKLSNQNISKLWLIYYKILEKKSTSLSNNLM